MSSVTGLGAALFERKGRIGSGFGILVDLFLVIVAAVFVARLIWVLITPAAFVEATPVGTSSSTSAQTATLSVDPRVFERFNPFNRDLEGQSVDLVDSAPETTLNLSIKALFFSSVSEDSSVRIQLPDNSVRRFKQGETVVSGVVIDRILSDRVVLVRNGQREVLFANEMRVLDRVTRDGELYVEPAQTAAVPVVSETTAPEVATIQLSSFEEFSSKVAVRRVADETGGTVLVVSDASDSAVLASLNVRAGDKLLSVNGYDLREESIADLYETLKSVDRLDFEISRDGVRMPRSILIGKNDD